MGALLATGMILGVFMVSMGWAAKPPVKKIALQKQPPMKAVPFKEYVGAQGSYQIRKPASWKVAARDNKMIMRSAGFRGGHGLFGVVRRSDQISNEQAIARELKQSRRLNHVKQVPAQIGGMRATKLIGTPRDNPHEKIVEYYVQNFDGQEYYILLQAPREHWNRYAVTFNAMLNSISFN